MDFKGKNVITLKLSIIFVNQVYINVSVGNIINCFKKTY